jgi:hypothetical protein
MAGIGSRFRESFGRAARRLSWVILAGAALMAGLAVTNQGGPVLRTLSFHDDFEDGFLGAWQFPFPVDWKILAEGPNHYLHMLRSRPPGVPRRPLQFALLMGPKVGSFEFRTRLRRERRSLIIVFNYVDTLHFYYAHLSVDTGQKQPVHNGIFIVNGGPRKRIAGLDAPAALADTNWHTARVVRDVSSGLIEVFMDGSKSPLFSVKDRTFTCGRVGIGSFDETGDFDDVTLRSDDANCTASGFVRPATGK